MGRLEVSSRDEALMMICGLIDQFDITMDEIEDSRF